MTTLTIKDPAPWALLDQCDQTLIRLRGLLHGLYASREYWPDKDAELVLIGLAQTATKEAEDLVAQVMAELPVHALEAETRKKQY